VEHDISDCAAARALPRARRAALCAGIGRAASLLRGVALMAVAAGLAAQPWEAGTDGLLPIPPLAARVTDLTQTLAPAEAAALEAKLADWEARTSNQLVVLIVPTTGPEPIEAYSIRVAEKWKIGRKGQDNGALFLVAKNDRKMRIEVGYGLEGVLTDVTTSRIIREDVAPAFRDNRFAAGINAGVDRIIAVVGQGSPLPPAKAERAPKAPAGFNIDTLLVILFVVVPVVGGILRRIFGRLLGSTVGAGVAGFAAWLFVGSVAVAIVAAIVAFLAMVFFGMGGGIARHGGGWSSTGGGWSGGGWSGGGGGGGFSGGGGGFGGGGASGNW
jgi:uncharacterized protein